MKLTTRLMLVFVAAALLISACGVAGRNALIGKWVDATSGMALEFTTDGRMRQVNPSQGVTTEIPYQFLNDTTFVLKPASASGSQDANVGFTISGDQLTLDLSGQQVKLARVK
jgi:hypothetical protein